MQRLRRQALPAWPNPTDSMGQRVNTRTRTVGGSVVWFPRGPALDRYNNRIRSEVQSILNNIEVPEGENLIVKLYMIGRSEQKANPIIMICCSDRATRQEAKAMIRESGLLDQHENSGFGLGSTGFPLEFTSLPRPLGKGTHSDSDPSIKDFVNIEIYGLTEPGIGRKLCFVASSRSGQTIQYATGGPIIRLGDDLCQLTVAHGMKYDLGLEAPHEQGLDLDDCEFDGQSEEEEDEHLVLSAGSLSPADSIRDVESDSGPQGSQASSTYSDSYSETRLLEFQDIGVQRKPLKSLRMGKEDNDWKSSALLCSTSMPFVYSRQLDYFLVRLPTEASELAQETNQITVDESKKSRMIQVNDIASNENQDARIMVITSRGPIHGSILPDLMSCKTSSSSSFQQLLTILLSEGLREGDSGSAVIDAQTGHFYGHVVLGVEGDCVAYVLSSSDIMIDIITTYRQLPVFYPANVHEHANSPPMAQFQHAREKHESISSHNIAPPSYDGRPHKTVTFGEGHSSQSGPSPSSILWRAYQAGSWSMNSIDLSKAWLKIYACLSVLTAFFRSSYACNQHPRMKDSQYESLFGYNFTRYFPFKWFMSVTVILQGLALTALFTGPRFSSSSHVLNFEIYAGPHPAELPWINSVHWHAALAAGSIPEVTLVTDMGQASVPATVLTDEHLLQSFTSDFSFAQSQIGNLRPGMITQYYDETYPGQLFITHWLITAYYWFMVRIMQANSLVLFVMVSYLGLFHIVMLLTRLICGYWLSWWKLS